METLVHLRCQECQAEFDRKLSWHNKAKTRNKHYFCSHDCCYKHYKLAKSVSCLQCGKSFEKRNADIKKSPRHFCSCSCSVSYNNVHKTKGTRRSKLEYWIESQLSSIYPLLQVEYNKKDAINSELDIYIPSMKLAFELNGIYHYEPIHGKDKLTSIQSNDNRKFQACLENKIELCIIDTSHLTYFKPIKAQKFLNIILDVINSKLP